MSRIAQAEPLKGLDADSDTLFPALEQLLQQEQADLTAADARRADFESRLATLEQRVTREPRVNASTGSESLKVS